MSRQSRYPLLYQINTRVWLNRLSRGIGRPATLADIPDAALDEIAARGFDWVWLLSVWQTGAASRAVSLRQRDSFRSVLPDLTDDDISGSGFAITAYTAPAALGGPAALAGLRERLRQRELKLMLDFVPNHTALDHPWVEQHPDFFVHGTAADLAAAPQNYLRLETAQGSLILAYGRDPYFPGWPDTLQLNYGNPALQVAQIAELLAIAGQCDGVRCDMAMLLLPEVFERTWGIAAPPFWPRALSALRQAVPGFTVMAEVYWGLEWTLQQQGFDYCYDKRLYDRLRERKAGPVRNHLGAGLDYQARLARFLENHDEPRAAWTFALPVHKAAAVVTFLAPGLRFFYQGQLEGWRVHVPPHLCRGPDEPTDAEIADFYGQLLRVLGHRNFRDGNWSCLDPLPAWFGNSSHDSFIAYLWQSDDGERHVAAVNYGPTRGQCRLILPFPDVEGLTVRLTDLMSPAVYDREGDSLPDPGLFIDLGPWGYNVFEVTTLG